MCVDRFGDLPGGQGRAGRGDRNRGERTHPLRPQNRQQMLNDRCSSSLFGRSPSLGGVCDSGISGKARYLGGRFNYRLSNKCNRKAISMVFQILMKVTMQALRLIATCSVFGSIGMGLCGGWRRTHAETYGEW